MLSKCSHSNTSFPVFFAFVFISFLYAFNKRETALGPRIPPKSHPLANDSSKGVAILVMVADGFDFAAQDVALKSLECYAGAQGYHFSLVRDSDYECAKNKKNQFRRYCVAAEILSRHDALLFIDGNIGVVNPRKRIETFLDDDIDVTFSCHFDAVCRSFLAKNTQYAMDMIRAIGDYEFKRPKSGFSGADDGAIHLFLAENLFENYKIEIELCRKAYDNVKSNRDLLTYGACIRTIFGALTDFGKVRILKKTSGWERDVWLTSGLWSPERDFMLHGWKTEQTRSRVTASVNQTAIEESMWESPFAGPFDLQKCTRGNTTWSYNRQLMTKRKTVEDGFRGNEEKVAFDRIEQIGRIYNLMEGRNE